MTLFSVVMGLIMGGFIYFLITIILEGPTQKRMKEKKFGKDSSRGLTKEDTRGFYIICAVVSALLGLLVSYLANQGIL